MGDWRQKLPFPNRNQLSGGEQQTGGDCQGPLVNEPKILLADEPHRKTWIRANAWEIMKLAGGDQPARGTTVLVVSHNMEIVDRNEKKTCDHTAAGDMWWSDVQMGGENQ